jgi:ribosomal protein L17
VQRGKPKTQKQKTTKQKKKKMYLLILNEKETTNEAKEFRSVVENAIDRVQALSAIEKINLFSNVVYAKRTAEEFGTILTKNYARRNGNTLYYEFINDNTLNCSYTILTLN